MNAPPMIRIEIDHMRQSLVTAFQEHQLQMDQMFKSAVEEALRPDQIQSFFDSEARRTIRETMKREIEGYFRSGDGRNLVRERAIQVLEECIKVQNGE